jgi:hypothetical protein
MNEELKEQTIKARIDELLADGAECHPWTHEHILEAIAQTDSFTLTTSIVCAVKLPGNPISEDALIHQIIRTVEDYWKMAAEYIAKNEFDSRRRDCEED